MLCWTLASVCLVLLALVLYASVYGWPQNSRTVWVFLVSASGIFALAASVSLEQTSLSRVWSVHTAALITLLMICAISDVASRTIPDVAVALLAGLGGLMLYQTSGPIILHGLSAILLLSVLWIVQRAARNTTSNRIIGSGDILLVTAIAVWLGPEYTLWAILLSSLITAVALGFFWIGAQTKSLKLSRQIAFAPALCVCSISIWILR